MPAAIRRRLTYANVVSSICLFLLLGGGAYAATKLPKNSVGAAQIRKNAISSSKVKNNSLQLTDFKAGQVPQGPRGAAGPAGERGPAGPPGSNATIGCPAGTALQSGFCFETSARTPAAWTGAATVCAAAGRRLATPSELWAIAQRDDVLMTAQELTSTIYTDTTATTGYGLVTTVFEFAPGGVQTGIRKGNQLDDAAVAYRCVVNPVSA